MKTTSTTSHSSTEIKKKAGTKAQRSGSDTDRQALLLLGIKADSTPDVGHVADVRFFCLVSRQRHAEWTDGLRHRFPWLPEDTHIDVAPGHVSIVERYLKKVGRLLSGKRIEFLSIESDLFHRPHSHLDIEKSVGAGQARAIEFARELFANHLACSVCGDDVEVDAFHRHSVCSLHKSFPKHGILFADDLTPEKEHALAHDSETEAEDQAQSDLATKSEFDDGWDGELEVASEDGARPTNAIRMYDPVALENVDKTATSRDRDTKARITGLVKSIRAIGCMRTLARVPVDWQQKLDDLEQEFPNFTQYVDALRSQLALSTIGDGVVQLLPVILNGPPGIGKSEILSRLADLLGLPSPLKIDFATAQNSSALTGSDAHWSNSSEGQLFRTLMLGHYANPIILIDEIEKNSNEGRYNPTAALYGLLEKTTAAAFEDLSLRGLKIDASHVLWVASANDVERLEAPILSRFTVIDVPRPTGEQTRRIQLAIWKTMVTSGELGVWFAPDKPLSSSTLDAMAGMSPRETKLALKLAAGRAVAANRKEIWPEDVRVSTRHEHARSHQIGFLAKLGEAA